MKAVSQHKRRSTWFQPFQATYYLLAVILAIYALAPLLVLIFGSLKSDREIGENPLGIPTQPLFSNFVEAWTQGDLGTTMFNSSLITIGTIVGVWVIAGLAAYAMTQLELPGRDGVLLYLVTCLSIPFQLFLVPLYFLWSNLNLTDNLFGLIIIYWAVNSPLAILLLRSFLIAVPREFREAALVDGASEFQVLIRVILPLCLPVFLTVGLVTGFAAWNEFTYAVTFISDNSLLPVSTSFLAFQQSFHRYWGLTNAAGLIIILPVILMFLLLQRRFIEGLASGGLKG